MSVKFKKPPGGYKVGYGKPPKETQFQKGKSGNPKGKPKASQPLEAVFLREGARLVTIKSGESVQKVAKRDALVRRLIDMARQGDIAAARLALPHLFAAAASGAEPEAAAPLSDAERAAMQILVAKLGEGAP